MRSRRFGTAIVLSLLLHLVLGLALWRVAMKNAAKVRPAEQTIELQIVHLPPLEAPKPAAPPPIPEVAKKAPQKSAANEATRPPRGSESKQSSAPAPRAPESKTPPEIASRPPPAGGGVPNPGGGEPSVQIQENAGGIAVPEGAPKRLELLPQSPFAQLGEGNGAGNAPDSGHGHTFHPDDPEFSPEVKKLEEEHRVAERVTGWANDGLAEARAGVAAGGGHPYFTSVGGAMRGGLTHTPGATPSALGAKGLSERMFDKWKKGMSEYARTGNPNLAPPGQAPRQSERQKELFGSEAQWAQALSQGMETQDDLKYGAPLLAVTFELLQGSDGQYKDGKILEGSGSPTFDAFVLRVVPGALGQLGPPPAEVLHGRDEVRSIWRIEGWQAYTQAELLMPSVGIEGVPLDRLGQRVKPEDRQFDFHAKLLRAY